MNGITIKNHHFSSFASNALVVAIMLIGLSITTNMFNGNIEASTPTVNYNYIANFDSKEDDSVAEIRKPKSSKNMPTYGYLQNGMYLLSNNVLVDSDDVKKYDFLLSLSELFQMKNYAAATKQIISKGLLNSNHPDRIVNVISAFYISSMFAEGRYVETLRHICNMIKEDGGATQKQITDIQFVIFRAFWNIRGQTNNEDALILEIARINNNCKGDYLSPYFGLVSSRHYNNINNGKPHEGFIDKTGRHKPLLNLFNRIDDSKDKYIDYARYSLGKFDEIIQFSKNKNIIALAHLSLASALLHSKPQKALVHAERYIELTNTKQFNLPKKIKLADNIKVSVDRNLDYLYRRYKGGVIADNFSGIIMEIVIDHINSGDISGATSIYLKAKNRLAFNSSAHKDFFNFMNSLSDISNIPDKEKSLFNIAILVRDNGWLIGIHVYKIFLDFMKRLASTEKYGDKSTYLIARYISHDNAKEALKYFHEFENKFPKSDLYDDVLAEIGVLYAFRLGEEEIGKSYLNRVAEDLSSKNASDNALDWLAKIDLKNGELSKALSKYVRIIVKYPRSRMAKISRVNRKHVMRRQSIIKSRGFDLGFDAIKGKKNCPVKIVNIYGAVPMSEEACILSINGIPLADAEHFYLHLSYSKEKTFELSVTEFEKTRKISMRFEK